MRISITAEPTTGTYDGSTITAQFVREYIAGCDHLITPGVASWDNVVTEDLPDGRISITADLTADKDTGPSYGHDKVTPEFVRECILGAEDNWLIPSSLFANEVTVS